MKNNIERLLDVLAGGQSDWDPDVVDAVRLVLIHEQKRGKVLEEFKAAGREVPVRQFNRLMEYVKELSGVGPGVPDPDLPDIRRPRLELVRSWLIDKALGGENRRGDPPIWGRR